MINIAIVGCTGKFGSMVAKMIIQSNNTLLAYAIGREGNPYINKDISEIIGGRTQNIIVIDDICQAMDCDVFIDCTNARNLIDNNLTKYKTMNKPLVIATTGYNSEDKLEIEQLSKYIPVFISGNFSIALHNYIQTLKFAVRRISDDTDVQIIEYHHKHKLDAPSGTALMIQDALIKANPKLNLNNTNICSIRSGTIFGEHIVMFANSSDEIIEYKHQVSSRVSFASGAISIATWLANQSHGLYGMDDFCN